MNARITRGAVAAVAVGVLLAAGCAAPATPASAPTTTAPRHAIVPAPSDIPKPDPRLSPGAVFPVTVAQVCTAGYATSVRAVSQAEKHAVFAEYGIASHAPSSYEVDHLISLELGGSNDIRNLWPEPYAGTGGAHAKDVIEDELHAQVCSHRISLATAQAEIVRWWTLPGASDTANTPPSSRPVAAPTTTTSTTTSSASVRPGAYCSPLGATGVTSAGTRMICSDHSASGAPYSGDLLHWRAA